MDEKKLFQLAKEKLFEEVFNAKSDFESTKKFESKESDTLEEEEEDYVDGSLLIEIRKSEIQNTMFPSKIEVANSDIHNDESSSKTQISNQMDIEKPSKVDLSKEEMVSIPTTAKMDHLSEESLRRIILEAVDEVVDNMKSVIRNDIQNIHLEILKQFHNQRLLMEESTEKSKCYERLAIEVLELKEENKRLKMRLGEK